MFSPHRGSPGEHFNTGKNKSKAAWSCFCSWAFCLCSATVLSRTEHGPKRFKRQTAELSTPFAVPQETRAPDWAAPGEMLSSIRPPRLTNKEKKDLSSLSTHRVRWLFLWDAPQQHLEQSWHCILGYPAASQLSENIPFPQIDKKQKDRDLQKILTKIIKMWNVSSSHHFPNCDSSSYPLPPPFSKTTFPAFS